MTDATGAGETLAAAGAPVSDAKVTVSWIPGLADSKPGDELPIVSVATATPARDGSYSISVTPTAAMRKAADANGGWGQLRHRHRLPEPGQGK